MADKKYCYTCKYFNRYYIKENDCFRKIANGECRHPRKRTCDTFACGYFDEIQKEITGKDVTYQTIADFIKKMKNKLDEVLLYLRSIETSDGSADEY